MKHSEELFDGCPVSARVVLLATGELPGTLSLGVRAHLLFCKDCQSRYRVHRAIHGALAGLDGPTLVPVSGLQTSAKGKLALAALAIAAVVAAGWLYTSWMIGENSGRLPAAAASDYGPSESKSRTNPRGTQDSTLERCEEK